ncbi:hypothetical protein [Lewinella sp. IMCC34183]|uniref:hypothetical protein n=1 Tax=Lewinella sp. IMCC34183 TaxID=2248762 RepID=UPI000E26EC9D|nr:hypothetical protein [Lewinella sp. IMCC34183]
MLLFFLGSSLFLTSCNKDEDDVTVDPNIEVTTQLEGTWDVESFTEDGVEYIGADITSFEMKFEKEGPSEGEVEMTIIYSEGDVERETSDFKIKNNGKEIRLDESDLEIEIDGDDLTLEGNLDGWRVEIEAERD